MERIERFSLATHEGDYQDWPGKSELLDHGKPTGKYVPGYVMEQQFVGPDWYFLVVSWDCLFEESQTLVLLNHDLDVLQRNSIGWMYLTVWFKQAQIKNKNEIEILFNGDVDWRADVTIVSNKKFKFKLINRNDNKPIKLPGWLDKFK